MMLLMSSLKIVSLEVEIHNLTGNFEMEFDELVFLLIRELPLGFNLNFGAMEVYSWSCIDFSGNVRPNHVSVTMIIYNLRERFKCQRKIRSFAS